MAEEQNSNIRQFVFPIKTGVGAYPPLNLIRMTIIYKLAPDDPEEFEIRFALGPDVAQSLVADLQSAMQDLQNLQ